MKRLDPLWQNLPKAKSQLNPDEPQRPLADPDREIGLRVLSYTEGQTPADIRRTFAESLEDQTELDPPLVFCAGELHPKFDEIDTAKASLNLPPRFLVNYVERILVESRHYERRMILGALRVRADLVFAGGETIPLYLLDDAAKSLPLLPAFPVMTGCEIRPREDLMEQQTEALLCVALGRVLHSRGN